MKIFLENGLSAIFGLLLVLIGLIIGLIIYKEEISYGIKTKEAIKICEEEIKRIEFCEAKITAIQKRLL